jgi:hypothetical protein
MRNQITAAFDGFINRSCLNCFPGLRDRLRRKWDEIEIDCTDAQCPGLAGFQSGNKVTICTTTASRIAPVLLHELVHAVGGTELDSEAVEHKCFVGNGATAPTGPESDPDSDWAKFRGETSALSGNVIERVGTFVVWNSDTGQVWGRSSSGGKGSLCFQHSAFVHDYTGSGGGGGSWV